MNNTNNNNNDMVELIKLNEERLAKLTTETGEYIDIAMRGLKTFGMSESEAAAVEDLLGTIAAGAVNSYVKLLIEELSNQNYN